MSDLRPVNQLASAMDPPSNSLRDNYLSEKRLLAAQQERMERFAIDQAVDVHCHCLPGLDDGPTNMDDAVALCRKITLDGTTVTIATPHQLGRYARGNSAARIREKVAELSAELVRQRVPLKILPGADVRIDEQLLQLLDNDHVMTVADGKRYILLELPHEIFVDPRFLIKKLSERGVCPIMTHPERYPYLTNALPTMEVWVAQGAIIQVTAGSLLGDFGPRSQGSAWQLVNRNLVCIVATDAHDLKSRPPRLTAAIEMLTSRMGAAYARRVCLANPKAILDGQETTR